MNEQYKSLVNWYYIEDWSDYPGPKGRVVPNAEGYDNPSDYDGAELYISQGTIGDKEGNLFIDEEGNDVPFNSEYFEKTNPLKENKMNKEQLRMQMLSGIITENQYKAKLNEDDMLDSVSDETYEKMNNLVNDDDYDNFINSATKIMKSLTDNGFEVKDIFYYLQTRLTTEV